MCREERMCVVTMVSTVEVRRCLDRAVPGHGPAGPWTGVELQGRVVADLLGRAERPWLQDMLHQVAIAAQDVEGLHHRLAGLVWRGEERLHVTSVHFHCIYASGQKHIV